jgi:hypothetical protein
MTQATLKLYGEALSDTTRAQVKSA